MKNFRIGPARLASLAVIALTLAACEPDEGVRSDLSHFALGGAQGPLDIALEDQLLGGGLGGALPAALPLLAGEGRDYGYAPSWDYVSDDYVDYAPQDPYDYYGYDDGYYDEGYYDAGYYGDDYYDASPGSGDFVWLALAALIAGVIGDSPPDYGYDYYGVQPWAWRTGDGYHRFVEPVYGGNRYYYYAPGAAGPFLVRDPYFSYAYQDDRLVALYDRDGRVIDAGAAKRHRRAAQHYLVRAKDLYRAASSDDRTGVYVGDWERRRASLAEDRHAWREARAEQAAWREWDKRNEKAVRRNWQRETVLRREAAEQFASWREDGHRGSAPRLYTAPERSDREAVAMQQARPERQRRAERMQIVDSGERATARAERRAEVREQREVKRQDRARPERIAAADRPRKADTERRQVRPERQGAQIQERQARTERRDRVERQAGMERQDRMERQQQDRVERQAQADRQRAEQQQRQTAQAQQRQAQQQARAERQAQADRQRAEQQQRQAAQAQQRQFQQQARAERQAQADRQRAEQQQRQAAQEQQRQNQQQARAERQAQADRQRAEQQQRQAAQEQQRQAQQQARAERQAQADRQRAEQQQRQAVQEQQRQAQQQARAEQQGAGQPAADSAPDEQRRGGRKGGRG